MNILKELAYQAPRHTISKFARDLLDILQLYSGFAPVHFRQEA